MAASINVHSAWALIVACGKSEQISPDVDTAFLQMGDQPVLAHTLLAFERCPDIDGVVVVAPKDRLEHIVGMARMYGTPKLKKIVGGAIQKTASIKAGLAAMGDVGATIIVLHESSQPCIQAETISETVKAAKRYGTAAAAQKLDVPVATIPKGLKAESILDPGPLWTVEMPVAVKWDLLEKALRLGKNKVRVDDTMFLKRLLKTVHIVPSEKPNLRIRTLADIQIVSTAMRV